jgi:hypothetical protein
LLENLNEFITHAKEGKALQEQVDDLLAKHNSTAVSKKLKTRA